MSTESGPSPDWEKIARRSLSQNYAIFFDEEVDLAFREFERDLGESDDTEERASLINWVARTEELYSHILADLMDTDHYSDDELAALQTGRSVLAASLAYARDDGGEIGKDRLAEAVDRAGRTVDDLE